MNGSDTAAKILGCRRSVIPIIYYTALSNYPFNADGIKIAVATTKDFKKIDTKRLITPFNAKAMTLFPEKINGKYVALLSVDTDSLPTK